MLDVADGNENKMKSLTVKMETVTLIGRGRQNLICFVYSIKCMKLTAKYFFLSRHFIFGRCLICGRKIKFANLPPCACHGSTGQKP
jgi:hypothetical protein